MGPELSTNNIWDQARLAQSAGRSGPSAIEQIAQASKPEQAARDFEATFIHQFLEHMWTGIETSEPFGGGHSEAVFRSMLNDEIAKKIGERGGIGLAEVIFESLKGRSQ